MEIINYVQNDSFAGSVGLNVPSFLRKEFSKLGKIREDSYPKEDNIFADYIGDKNYNYGAFEKQFFISATRIKPKLSVKSVLRAIGRWVSNIQSKIAHHSKSILLTSVIAIVVTIASVFSYSYFLYKINHTGQLALATENSYDIENLNKLMASFALDGSVEYSESGELLDSTSFAPQVFTQPVSYQTYVVKPGDTISDITMKMGLRNLSTLISINDIGNVRQLAAGQKLKVPSIDGVIYTVKEGDTLEDLIIKNNISMEAMLDVNDLSSKTLEVGQQLFLPGVALDSTTLRNAMGDLFKMPISAPFRWTSMYGKRIDPIANVESFHTGVDMACPKGTPILASMSGRVTKTGVTRVYGNYVIIDHANGYQTLYAHMSKIIAKEGQWVNQGTRIGLVGSTGYSTGPHLHFTVYKNGQLIDPMSVLNK